MNWFGIDFGTTNTSACDALTGRTFGDGLGAPLPSIIAIDKVSDSVLTGRDAWERRFELKDRGDYEVIRSVKPCLDTFTSKQGHRGRIWEVVDVVALVLETLKKNIATASGSDVTTATFGVPADLTPSARRTLRAAALQAGIAVSTFVKESTAAIISEWANVKGSRNVAVFDWGGGTLDVSVTQMQGSKIAELATKGVPVAGNVIDEEIAQFVHGRIMMKRAVSKDLTEISPPVYNDLLVRCENAKCTLSEVDIAHFSIFQYDRQDEVVELTREELRPLLAPFVSRALDTLFSAIREACLPLELIDRIIITGGCSKLWLFREALLSDPRLSARVVWAREPEWAVARGAAVLQKDPGAFELSESIAIELCDGAYLDLFAAGTMRANPTSR